MTLSLPGCWINRLFLGPAPVWVSNLPRPYSVLEQLFPTFLAPGTGFVVDNFSMDQGGGWWFQGCFKHSMFIVHLITITSAPPRIMRNLIRTLGTPLPCGEPITDPTLEAATSWAVLAAISREHTMSSSNFPRPCTTISAASLESQETRRVMKLTAVAPPFSLRLLPSPWQTGNPACLPHSWDAAGDPGSFLNFQFY